jgi:hypothetical protein
VRTEQISQILTEHHRTPADRAPEVLGRPVLLGYGARMFTNLSYSWILTLRALIALAALMVIAFVLGYVLHPV